MEKGVAGLVILRLRGDELNGLLVMLGELFGSFLPFFLALGPDLFAFDESLFV